MKMFCFPHAGGFSRYYHFLKYADYDMIEEVLLYEYAGRDKRLNCVKPESFDQLTDLAVQFVSTHLKEGEEFVFFGHSMGAFVAYEAAVKLKQCGEKVPKILFLSGQRPPCTLEKGYYSSDPEVAIPFFRKLGGMENIWDAVPAVQDFFLPIVLGDVRLLETYQPTIPSWEDRLRQCVLLYGEDDVELENRDMSLWETHFEIVRENCFPHGGHFYIENNQEQIVQVINRAVREMTG